MPRITSWLEVEKRLANFNNQIQSAEDRLVKTNDSINAFLNALVLNLKDLLESQSDISLWFYDENEPTTSNLPYTSWTTPSDHYGDFFYSRTKGLVFQFTSNGWVKLEDATMLNAMALTNSKLGANDHERKVFLDNPTTPYTSGDWWIREDGTLYICQLSRASGKREENDFIDALNYAETVAKATDNIVEVLKGTLITTTDNAVIYEDKATHKTTTISGDSIRTGEIISNNYVANTNGTKFNLNDGTIDSKNFKVSSNGTITATNGSFTGEVSATSGNFGTLITTNGVFTTIVYSCLVNNEYMAGTLDDFEPFGFGQVADDSGNISIKALKGIFDVQLPQNFTMNTAKVYIGHVPLTHEIVPSTPPQTVDGKTSNLQLYSANKDTHRTVRYSGVISREITGETIISNAFGSSSGFSGLTTGRNSAISIDVSNYINNNKLIVLKSNATAPSTYENSRKATGGVQAILIVTGYLKT